MSVTDWGVQIQILSDSCPVVIQTRGFWKRKMDYLSRKVSHWKNVLHFPYIYTISTHPYFTRPQIRLKPAPSTTAIRVDDARFFQKCH